MQAVSIRAATAMVAQWVTEQGIALLNVAGPSEGRAPGTADYVAGAIRAQIDAKRR